MTTPVDLTSTPTRTAVSWRERLRVDRARAKRNQTSELAAITAEVEARCRSIGSESLIELSSQLGSLACEELADALHRAIHERPPELVLRDSLAAARALADAADLER